MPASLLSGPTISAGEPLSASINCGGQNTQVIAIVMPSEWDPAPLTFQWSIDNIAFFDLFDKAGREVEFVVCPGTIAPLESVVTVQYLKFRSGPRSSPIPQSADRVFSVLIG